MSVFIKCGLTGNIKHLKLIQLQITVTHYIYFKWLISHFSSANRQAAVLHTDIAVSDMSVKSTIIFKLKTLCSVCHLCFLCIMKFNVLIIDYADDCTMTQLCYVNSQRVIWQTVSLIIRGSNKHSEKDFFSSLPPSGSKWEKKYSFAQMTQIFSDLTLL